MKAAGALGGLAKFLKTAGIALAVVTCAGLGGAEIGVDDATVVLGQSLPLTGPLAPRARQRQDGARMHFEALNAAGGVHGRQIVLLSLDDGADAQRSLANTRSLLYQHRVLALFGDFGTPGAAAHLPIVQAERVPLLLIGPAPAVTAGGYQRYYFQFGAWPAPRLPSETQAELLPAQLSPETAFWTEYLTQVKLRRQLGTADPDHFRGYLAASLLAVALERTGRDLTREKLVTALEELERDGLAGCSISFSPTHLAYAGPAAKTLVASRGIASAAAGTQAQAQD